MLPTSTISALGLVLSGVFAVFVPATLQASEVELIEKTTVEKKALTFAIIEVAFDTRAVKAPVRFEIGD